MDANFKSIESASGSFLALARRCHLAEDRMVTPKSGEAGIL